jgi:hypothetical protein
MIKYKTKGWGKGQIEMVEVDRETDSSVFIDGYRRAKRSSYDNFFDTWEDAHAYLLKKAENSASYARRNLEIANGELGNIRGLKNPD